jgi:hypothetical protein
MPYWLLPIMIVGGLLGFAALLLGTLFFLSRFRKGRYLKAVVTTLTKVPLLKRLFQKVSTAALERQNPELISVMRKLERVQDPAKAQQVIHGLNPAERRAYNQYIDMVQEQGEAPELPNRQARRLQQRQYGQPRSPGSSGGQRKRKRR